VTISVCRERHRTIGDALCGIECILHEICEHLNDLIAIGTNRRRASLRDVCEMRLSRRWLVHLNDVTSDLLDIEINRAWRRQSCEARELRHDVRDAMHFIEHRACRFIEVLVKARIFTRAKSPQGLDRRSDRRKWILDFMSNATRDLTPCRNTARCSKSSSCDGEVFDHAIECGAEIAHFTGSANANRLRITRRDFAHFLNELGQWPADVPREKDRREERNDRGDDREDGDRAIDLFEIRFKLGR
jgi:hypothetical protein